MASRYSPVDTEPDQDETPRRFRLRSDGLARPFSPSTSTPTRSGGHDNLERAMNQLHSSFDSSPVTHSRSSSANIASPTPQRHGSVSSSSLHSRSPSTQETYVNEQTHHVPWSQTQPQHVQQQQQQPQQVYSLPPIPTTSPLYQQPSISYSSFHNQDPISAVSTGPQIVPVHTWNSDRHHATLPPLPATTPLPTSSHPTGYSWAPQSAYGQPISHTRRTYSTPQHVPNRSSYLAAGDPYLQTRSRSQSPDGYDDDYEKYDYRHSRYSSIDPEAVMDEKPLGGYNMSEYQAPDEEEPEVDTMHYGPAPAGRQLRRRKTKKKIPLTQGHFVLDQPVPTRLVLSYKTLDEMKKTRYTAVTCDPDEFVKKRFSLRQVEYGRQTELFICITMYNENEVLFCRTLYGVMKNIAHLSARKSSKVWGGDAWKKVVVCIVADGRKSINLRVLDCLTALGVYQGEHMKNMVNGQPVQAHMFEYTCGFGIDPDLHFRYPDKGIVPTQIIFLMKEHNQKKINSHRWFFNAFGPVLQPNICVLLDVGTRPGPNSLYHLWKAFDMNSNVGGACGEIAVYKGPFWSYLLNPLVATQNFEYKMSNILDKPNESMFGYISVLPGAFSAYRYIALQNDKNTGRGPLASYFKGEVLHGGRDTDIFTSNMYLAEDRILAFELVAKENSNWILKYVKSSVGETDVPDSLDELIMQRRRWLNGSFFAAIYSLAHVRQILSSGHGVGRKVWLLIESVYNLINLIFAWFAIGNYCLFFVILTSSIEDPVFSLPHSTIHFTNLATHYLLATIIMSCFLFSMGNRPKASPWKYNTSTGLLALLTGYLVACGIMCAIRAINAIHSSALYRNMVFSILVTYGTWFASSVLALDPWHLATCMAQYILLAPLYIVVLNIYAFANLDDITWGTKGSDLVVPNDLGNLVQDSQNRVAIEISPEEPNDHYVEALENLKTKKPLPRVPGLTESEKDQIRKDYYANIRTNLLLWWALSNALLVVLILSGTSASDTFGNSPGAEKLRGYMTFILAFVAITNIIRFLGSTMYMMMVAITG